MTQPLTTNSLQASADLPPGWQEVDAVCPKHGACKARIMPDIFGTGVRQKPMLRCPACYEEREAQAIAAKAKEEQQRRDEKLRRLFGSALIPLRFQERRLSNYNATTTGQKRALQVCQRFVDNWEEGQRNGTSLIFTGGPGTGKTHLACGIASELIEQHYASALFLTTLEAMRSIKATYNRDSEMTEQDAVDNLLRPGLLILDEVGVQVGSEHEKLLLFDVLNSRYQECRPTILLSNLSMTDLEGYLGQRIMDRYRECGAVIAFDWESHRGQR